jgi:hypothetical protein
MISGFSAPIMFINAAEIIDTSGNELYVLNKLNVFMKEVHCCSFILIFFNRALSVALKIHNTLKN